METKELIEKVEEFLRTIKEEFGEDSPPEYTAEINTTLRITVGILSDLVNNLIG